MVAARPSGRGSSRVLRRAGALTPGRWRGRVRWWACWRGGRSGPSRRRLRVASGWWCRCGSEKFGEDRGGDGDCEREERARPGGAWGDPELA
jgi:hypothetical protein